MFLGTLPGDCAKRDFFSERTAGKGMRRWIPERHIGSASNR
jgi:hypothetical protein